MDDLKREEIEIAALDGVASAITVFTKDHVPLAPVLVCMPAMGVPARYYEPLAEPIVKEGWRFVTADLRGVGLSSIRVRRGVSFGYHEMVSFDWPAVVLKAQALFPGAPVYLLGHSLGGQLSVLFLAANPGAASGLILVAAPSVHWRGWDPPPELRRPGCNPGGMCRGKAPRVFPGTQARFRGDGSPWDDLRLGQAGTDGSVRASGERNRLRTADLGHGGPRPGLLLRGRFSLAGKGRREPPVKNAPGPDHARHPRG